MHKLMISTVVSALSLFAQGLKIGPVSWTGEIEFSQDQKGHQAYDNQNFGTMGRVSLLARLFCAESGPQRGELAMGMNFVSPKKSGNPRVFITAYVGSTTDGAVFTPAIIGLRLLGHSGYYLADPKFFYHHPHKSQPHPDTQHQNTLYQRASVGLNKSGGWQWRWERLQVTGGLTLYNRFGIERRIWRRNQATGNNSHFHISPFLDTTSGQIGFYTGFRWR